MIASNDTPAVIPVTIHDLDTVAAVLAEAHQDDPVAQWVVPDPQQRPHLIRAWYRILVEHALSYGAVDMLADRSGAAVWLDRTRPLPDPREYERRLTGDCGLPGLDMLMAEHISGHHHFPVPHLHLTHLGVERREHRRQRLGALLAHRHGRLDAAGVLSAAAANNDDDVDLFSSHGYRLGAPYCLPDGPRIWPMLRLTPPSARQGRPPADRRSRR